MDRFKSPRQVQRFRSVNDRTATLFRPNRHQRSAISYHHSRDDAFSLWNEHAAEMTT